MGGSFHRRKKMSDEYIRKEDASDWLKQYGQDVLHGKYKFSLMYIWKNIMDLPSADVVPVVHGKWIDEDPAFAEYFANCSVCGYEIDVHNERGYFNFCPNCGAKMEDDEA